MLTLSSSSSSILFFDDTNVRKNRFLGLCTSEGQCVTRKSNAKEISSDRSRLNSSIEVQLDKSTKKLSFDFEHFHFQFPISPDDKGEGEEEENPFLADLFEVKEHFVHLCHRWFSYCRTSLGKDSTFSPHPQNLRFCVFFRNSESGWVLFSRS